MLAERMYAAIRKSTQPPNFREKIDLSTLDTDIEGTKKKFRNRYYHQDGSVKYRYEPLARFVEVSVNEVREVESDSVCHCSAYSNPHLRGESKCRK